MQLALAAYNAGPQAVVAAGYSVPAISETQQYVRCVFSAYEQYRQSGAVPLLPDLRPLQPGTRALSPRLRALTPSAAGRQTLLVSPLRLSSQVAQVGQRLTMELKRRTPVSAQGMGMVMLNYPEHLVSFMALHTVGQETTVQLPAAPPNRQPRLRRDHSLSILVESLASLGPWRASDSSDLPGATPAARYDAARQRDAR